MSTASTEGPRNFRPAAGHDNDGRYGDRYSEEPRTGRASAAEFGLDRDTVLHRGKERFGGVKAGSAFFGWLTPTAVLLTALLTALLSAGGTAVEVATGTNAGTAASTATKNPATVGIVGAIVLAVIPFLAHYCGGYVAGRKARFNGARVGRRSWVWALLIALAVALLQIRQNMTTGGPW